MQNQEKTFGFKSFRHRRFWVNGHCFCLRVRGLATGRTPRGKFQIKSNSHSGERIIARVAQDCVGALPGLLLPSTRSGVSRVYLVFLQSSHPCSSPAEQGARANADTTARASRLYMLQSPLPTPSRRVLPYELLNETSDPRSSCRTRRAGCRRGSSMTFGKGLKPRFLTSIVIAGALR
jgi:hypothetical protein